MDEDGFDAAWAVGQLEQANRRLLECGAGDVAEMEAALAERDEAVRAIAEVDPEEMEPALAERLLRAFEDGRTVRRKLVEFYRDTEVELKRAGRFVAEEGPPGISAVG